MTVYRTLRILRTVISLAIIAVLTAALVWSILLIPGMYEWITSVQLIPAATKFSMVIFVIWLIMTLLFGRIYCSTVCPLGTLQDIASRTAILLRKRPANYRYSPPRTTLRYTAAIITLLCLLGGFWLPISLLDPYELYARFCTDTFAPASRIAEDGLIAAGLLRHPFMPILATTGVATALSTLLFIAVIAAAAHGGRTVCNTLCPVGTTLGLISRYAFWQMDIDTDKCTHCGRCEQVCKASCIDLKLNVVDGSRCVNCMNCADVCPDDAIHYTWRRKQLSDPMMQRISKSRKNDLPAIEEGAATEFNYKNTQQ